MKTVSESKFYLNFAPQKKKVTVTNGDEFFRFFSHHCRQFFLKLVQQLLARLLTFLFGKVLEPRPTADVTRYVRHGHFHFRWESFLSEAK